MKIRACNYIKMDAFNSWHITKSIENNNYIFYFTSDGLLKDMMKKKDGYLEQIKPCYKTMIREIGESYYPYNYNPENKE